MVVTEFGRSLVQKCGVMASYVNDVLLRPCYLPEKWRHRFSVICGKSGEQKCCNVGGRETSESSVQDIAGPLCFSGDLICRNRLLPNMEAGDVVVAHDTGGYSIGMFSRYNSRLCLPVYVYRSLEERLNFVLKSKRRKCGRMCRGFGVENFLN